MEAILQTASDFVVDTDRDTLDTAAAGETTGGGGVSVSVFPLVSSMFRSGGPTIGLLSQQQDARKRKKRTYRMAGFATQ